MTTEHGVISDDTVRRAVGRIEVRSERETDLSSLAATFVDSGLIALIDVPRNQVVYGRRGTGKTHVLRYLESQYLNKERTVVTYIDMRTLGSSTLFSDPERPVHDRFIGLYKDVLTTFISDLFEYTVQHPEVDDELATDDLRDLERLLTHSQSTESTQRIKSANAADAMAKNSIGAELSITNIKATAGIEYSTKNSAADEVEVTSTQKEKIIFPAVFDAFTSVIEHLNLTQYLILIDEWASIPSDLQPHLAELLNRIFFANPKVTIKIAALEFRSTFASFHENGSKLYGLELGGDIETIDLDEYYVYDRDPAGTEQIFADVLFRHVNAAIGDDDSYLAKKFGITTFNDFQHQFFTDVAFKELARAAEGVVRELLQIFTRSYTISWRTKAAHITAPNVTKAAQDWFESDKQANLGQQQQDLLRRIIDDVIAGKKARSFLVDRDYSNAPLLRSLIGQRVVHLIRKGYADKDRPGTRYNIYTLDYGCYVDLKGTKMEPQMEFEMDLAESTEELIVPFDDKRSIRRIIAGKEILSPATD